MKKFCFLCMIFALMAFAESSAQDLLPSISPTARFYAVDGTEDEGTSYSGSAPLRAQFFANAEHTAGWDAHYEWRFTLEGEDEPYLKRFEEDTEFTFTKAGGHRIVLYAVFVQGNDTVKFTEEYWETAAPLTVGISESKLEFPNAFSPNNDGHNDYYQAKGTKDGNGPQSIVEFEAHIFNRWGQKLYSWTDCYTYEAGWDGKYKGKPVKDGVYYVLVKARGADGRKFNIKRDVNLLRGVREGDTYGTE